MSFIESPRFPEAISYGATGGPGYQTDVIITDGGQEYRNQAWSQARAVYEVSHAARMPTEYKALQAFFRVVAGRTHGFRFKDWSDFEATTGQGVLSVITTDTTWQMYRQYAAGSNYENRKITKPVSGALTVAGGGTYTIDYATGIITKTGGANPTSWTGQYDVPARFDTDRMVAEVVTRSGSNLIIGWSSIPIVELRL